MSNGNAQSSPRQRVTVNGPPQRPRRGPTFFFGLAVAYLILLLLLAVGREAGFWFLDDLHDPIAGVLPLGVPWFGALGAVTLSFYGVFDHNDHWDYKWNYWYVARPLVGIVLAIIAYFIFITLISSTGLTPRTSGTTSSTTTTTTLETTTTAGPTTTQASATTTGNSGNTGSPYQPQPAGQVAPPTSAPAETGGNAPGPSSLLPYYVLAFLVGFREGTFRTLIKRAADVLLGPGDPGAPPAGITVHPAPVQFYKVTVGGGSVETVTVSNSGTGDLRIYPPTASSPGTDLADENGVFSLSANAVEGATIAPGANATLKVEFTPAAAETYTGTLTIASNAGTTLIDVIGEGVAPEKPEETKPAGRGPLTRFRRRGRRNR
jgi:hypothetical protein